ncbi:ion channel protein [Agromyces mediolanus]|uniref:Ion-transport protein YfeO n=1 Tax=Agromyces mediolanus TaxID=41986 RepID=A0A918CEY8_AGRME|nr:ion channel protein [Agromyces mediolanus]GGR18567.1 putative ion-transport protein YfeO [Agromyces mediolanus]GLJ71427.1 putative ion-transport protein YfeO [Agromyces mediolanus]
MQLTPAPEAPGSPTVRHLLLLSIPALVIGAASALVLWLVDLLAEQLHVVLWEALPGVFGADAATPWWILVVLTATGAAVGLVVQFAPGHAGADSATTELDAPPMPLLVVPSLLVAVVLSLAGGVSLGPENPIIAINTALAVALLARLSKAVPQQLVVLLASAATIGALFGTPVAAALVLTGTVAAVKAGGALWDKLFLPLAAAGAGAITMHLLGGSSISFTVTPMGEVEPVFLLTGLLVAAVSALAGILAAWALPPVHRAFHSLRHPLLFTTLGGLVLGLLGMIGGPMTLFKGLEQTGELIEHPERYGAGQLALFAGIKIVALVIAAAAGFRGGRIFPAVFIGVAIGLLGYALIPGLPLSLAIACGALGIVLAATKDGWIAIFVGVALVGDPLVLPLLCVIVLPVWLLVTKAPELVVHPSERPGVVTPPAAS